MITAADLAVLLESTPAGYRSSTDQLFKRTNKLVFPAYKKLGVIVADEYLEGDENLAGSAEISNRRDKSIFCNEVGCNAAFTNIADYQAHFNSSHRFICAQCKRALPTAHLLDIHVEEQHDSYFAARLARGTEPMYACYLEACKARMATHEERKDHCIKEHNFPANYRFDQVKQKTRTKHNTDDSQDAMVVDDSEPHTSKFPYTKSFGHPKEKTFDTRGAGSKHRDDTTEDSKLEDGKTLEDVQDLKDALDDVMK